MVTSQRISTFFAVMLLTVLSVGGCASRANEKVGTQDNITWLEEGRHFDSAAIGFGYRGQSEVGDWIEPAVAVTRGGNPVVDAMVFVQLVSPDGQSALSDEVATVFEPSSSGNRACYAQGKLQWPAEAQSVAVRVRIVMLDTDKEWSNDFMVKQDSQPIAAK